MRSVVLEAHPRCGGGVYLRPYRTDDFEAIFALDTLCFAPRFRFTRAMMRHVVSDRGGMVTVACERDAGGGELLVGFCAANLKVRRHSSVGYVATVDVMPGYRRSGVGEALMLELERMLAEKGARRMELHVYCGNDGAIRLYERLGYVCVGRVPDFYGAGFAALAYSKLLPASPFAT